MFRFMSSELCPNAKSAPDVCMAWKAGFWALTTPLTHCGEGDG